MWGEQNLTESNTGRDVLARLLSSEVKGELLTLFHKNPGLVDTVGGVARRIGRNEAEIEPDVSDLLEMGILQSKTLGRLKVVSFDRAKDREVQESLVGYFKGLKS